MAFFPVGPLRIEEQTPVRDKWAGVSSRLGAPTDTLVSILAVPTICRFFGITITMYFDDHDPPHFHARHATGGAKIEIESLEVMDSALERRQLRFVLAWAELHQEELMANWRRARAGETLEDIEPLR